MNRSALPRITPLSLILFSLVVALGWLLWHTQFSIFRGRYVEDPTQGLTVVEILPEERYVFSLFRKVVVHETLSLSGKYLGQLDRLLEQTQENAPRRLVPKGWDQRSADTARELLGLMKAAKRVRVPARFEQEYHQVIWGIHYAYLATLSFRDYCTAKNSSTRTTAYQECLVYRKKADSKLKRAGAWFRHDARSTY